MEKLYHAGMMAPMDAFLYRIRTLLDTALDLIAPRPQRRMRAEVIRAEDVAVSVMTTPMLGADVITLAPYKTLRDLIQALKYDRSSRSAHTLSLLLADFLREDIASRQAFSQQPILLIPVPLDAKRRRDRGYSQIGMVTDALPREFKDGTLSRIASPLLERTRSTRAQTMLTRVARLSNVAGAFAVTDPSSIRGTHVYLIDDVATTGATLVHAARPLLDAGATVTLLALARS